MYKDTLGVAPEPDREIIYLVYPRNILESLRRKWSVLLGRRMSGGPCHGMMDRCLFATALIYPGFLREMLQKEVNRASFWEINPDCVPSFLVKCDFTGRISKLRKLKLKCADAL